MNYVSKVGGNLVIADIHLELSYMELIDLSSEDFKASPRLREALRNKEIEIYVPNVHLNAKKIKERNSHPANKEESNQIDSDTKKLLVEMSGRLNYLISKMELLISKEKEDKIENLAQNVKINDDKFDLILKKLDNLASKDVIITKGTLAEQKQDVVAEIPVYVPQLDVSDVSTKNILSEEAVMEGTDDILEQLKKLK